MAQTHYINSFAVSLAAVVGAQAIATPIELPRDGFDVEFTRLSITQIVDGEVVPSNVLIQITEQGGTNTGLFVQPQHSRNLAGDGSIPWALAEPFKVNGNLRLQLVATNLGSEACDVYVTLHGRRVNAGTL